MSAIQYENHVSLFAVRVSDALFTPNLLSSDRTISWVEDLRRNPGQVSLRLKFESWILSLREATGKDHDPKIWCGKFN